MFASENNAKWIINQWVETAVPADGPSAFLHPNHILTARNLVRSMDLYEPTPLVSLTSLAENWGLASVQVKDESKRFGLNAFKVLGGIFAVANVICEKMGVSIHVMTFEKLLLPEVREQLGPMVFVTATDGNHGRGIAWAANKLGQQSVVFMPKGSSLYRLEMIQREGAEASITELNYDDAVRHARKYAEENGAMVVQDTSWEGYEDIPAWIMQGYAVIMDEIREELQASGQEPPTHVFLQAGVGSFAGGIQGYLAETWREKRPKTVILEPDQTDCYYRSAAINDGMPHAVTGHMETIMAGLACGEPNLIGWRILRKYAHAFVSCPDGMAARGMRVLAAPLPGDAQIISGESGAVGIGFLAELMVNPGMEKLRLELGIDRHSRILVISTEGDTDPDQFRKIVWEGAYPSL